MTETGKEPGLTVNLDKISALFFLIDRESKVVDANRGACQTLGYSREELTKMSIPDVMDRFPHEAWFDHWEQVREIGSMAFECDYRMRTGATFCAETTADLLKMGEEQYVVWSALEIRRQKRLEDYLRRTDERYRTIFENAPVGMYQTSLDGRFITANRAVARLVGYRSSEELMQAVTDIGTEIYADPQDRAELIRLLCERDSVQSFESRYRRQDGSTVRVAMDARIVRNERGNPRFIEGFVRDIAPEGQTDRSARSLGNRPGEGTTLRFTGRMSDHRKGSQGLPLKPEKPKGFEVPLHEAKAYCQALFEETRDSVCIIDAAKGDVLDVNPAGVKMFGRPKSEIVGKQMMSLHTSKQGNPSEGTLLEITGYPKGHPIQASLVGGDGRVLPVEAKSRIIDLPCGDRIVLAFFRDLSEREQMENSLTQSEKRFSAVAENTVDWIWETDGDGRYVYSNGAVENMLGYSPGEICGKACHELLPLDRDRLKDVDPHVLSEGEEYKGRLREVLHRDGRLVCMESSATPVMDDQGRWAGYRGVDKDVTDLLELEKKMLDRDEELIKKNIALKELEIGLKMLLDRVEQDKKAYEARIVENMSRLVLPYLEKIRGNHLNPEVEELLEIVHANLNNVLSPFLQKIHARFTTLTQNEITVANLIRNGKSIKEISNLMGLSESGVNFHRQSIRNKLGLRNNKTSLYTYLLSLSDQ